MKKKVFFKDVQNWQSSNYSNNYRYAAADGGELTTQQIDAADAANHHYHPAKIGVNYFFFFKGSPSSNSFFAFVSADGKVHGEKWVKDPQNGSQKIIAVII